MFHQGCRGLPPLLAVAAPGSTVAVLTQQVGARTMLSYVSLACNCSLCATVSAMTLEVHPLTQGKPWPCARDGVQNVRGASASRLCWHPNAPLLAIAWKDGALSLWDAMEQRLQEDNRAHRAPACHLVWNSTGSHLLTVDTVGKVWYI